MQPLSGKGLRQQIASGGRSPVWRKDGKEILFFSQGKIWSVIVQGSAETIPLRNARTFVLRAAAEWH